MLERNRYVERRQGAATAWAGGCSSWACRLRLQDAHGQYDGEPDRLASELVIVRKRGHAVDKEEFEEGLRCVGAPVFGLTGEVAAAVSIAGPAYRLSGANLDKLGRSVISVARQLSEVRAGRNNNTADQAYPTNEVMETLNPTRGSHLNCRLGRA